MTVMNDMANDIMSIPNMTLNDLYNIIRDIAVTRDSLILEHSLGWLHHSDFVTMFNAKNMIIDLLISEYRRRGGKRRVDQYRREDLA